MTLRRMDNVLNVVDVVDVLDGERRGDRRGALGSSSMPSSAKNAWAASRSSSREGHRARQRSCRHHHDEDSRRPRPRRAIEVPHPTRDQSRARRCAGERTGHTPHHASLASAATVPNFSTKSHSTRTSTDSASCVAPRGSSSDSPSNSSNATSQPDERTDKQSRPVHDRTPTTPIRNIAAFRRARRPVAAETRR